MKSMACAFYLDANAVIGYGHLYRCLPILAELRKEIAEIAVFGKFDHKALSIFRKYSIEKVYHIEQSDLVEYGFKYLKSMCSFNLIVIDTYWIVDYLNENYRQLESLVFVIGDKSFVDTRCDVYINPTPNLKRSDLVYCTSVQPKEICIGEVFYPISQEMIEVKKKAQFNNDSCRPKIFINLGSGEVFDTELIIGKSISKLPTELQENIFWLTNHAEQLTCSTAGRYRTLDYIDDMASFLSDIDIAIGAGGVNAIERCFMGIYQFLIQTVDNQALNIEGLVKLGVAERIDDIESLLPNLFNLVSDRFGLLELKNRCANSIPDYGAKRLAEKIIAYLKY